MGLPPVLFGTLREHYLFLFGAAGGVALFTGFAGAWIGARIGARSAERQRGAGDTPELATKAEVRQLADGVDAVLLEMERITEGQRFVAKLLAERAAVPPTSGARRKRGQITPH